MNDNFNTRMILTTAVFAAVAALLVGPASAHVMDIEGGGVDESQSSGQPSVELSGDTALKVDRAVAAANEAYDTYRDKTAIAAEASAKQAAQSSATSGPIPYLSHGIGVDQSLFQGEQQQSLGLTGDSPITRVVGQEPAGLTGDSPRTRGQVFQANSTFASSGDTDVNWTWVGFGAGMSALLAAAMGALYLSARHRDRVALP